MPNLTPTDLAARRAALGLSQAALARAIGCSRSTILEWERGTRRIERPEMLDLALRALEQERGAGGSVTA